MKMVLLQKVPKKEGRKGRREEGRKEEQNKVKPQSRNPLY